MLFGQARQGGNWWEQDQEVAPPAQPQIPAPPPAQSFGRVTTGERPLPPPQTGAQATIESNRASASELDRPRAEAALRAQQAQAAAAEAAAEETRRRGQMGGLTAVQRQALESRYSSLGGFERQLQEVERLYRENFEGSRGGILGVGADRNVAGYLPNLVRPSNQTFDTAANRLIDQIAQVYGISGGELNSLAELRARLGPYLPTSTDNDQTIQSKINSLRGILDEQRRTLGGQLGIEQQSAAPSGAALVPPISGVPAPGGPAPEGDMLEVDVTGGRLPDTLAEASPEWREAFNRAWQQDNSLTFQEFVFQQSQAMQRQQAQRQARESAPPPGRGNTPPTTQNLLERDLLNNAPFVGPVFQGYEGLRGRESGDAFRRGLYDVTTLGLQDRIRAGIGSSVSGGSYDEALGRERAVSDYDARSNFGDRLAGQFAGGALLPMSRAGSLGRAAGESALYGGSYGFNSSYGSASDRLASGAIGATIGAAIPPTLAGGARLLRGGGAAERQATREAAERIGVDLPRMDAGGTGTRMAAGVVGRTFGEIPMVQGARQGAASAGSARDRIAASIGTVVDDVGAGQAAQSGARQFIQSSRDRGEQLLNRIPIRPEAPATLDNTRAALQELTAGLESNPELSALLRNPELERFQGALQRGGLSWGDMRRFRTLIGQRIEQPPVAGENAAPAALRRLYGALSQDMEATAERAGPRALTAFRRHNQYWRGREARREGIISDILGPQNDASPEQAFSRINRWAQERGGNYAAVARTLRSLPADEANTVRASIFARMGEATPGRQDADGTLFSPATFATQWQQLSDRAKSFLIPNAQHRRDLNDLARVTTAMRQTSQYQNHSNTTLGTNAIAFFAGLQLEPMSTITAALGSFAAGRFLASPVGASWLSRMTRTRTPNAVRANIRQLSAVASRDPAIAQEAFGLRQALLRAANDNAGQLRGAAATPRDDEENR